LYYFFVGEFTTLIEARNPARNEQIEAESRISRKINVYFFT
jgi:hypothetical protein